jgi:hypothetical protein
MTNNLCNPTINLLQVEFSSVFYEALLPWTEDLCAVWLAYWLPNERNCDAPTTHKSAMSPLIDVRSDFSKSTMYYCCS